LTVETTVAVAEKPKLPLVSRLIAWSDQYAGYLLFAMASLYVLFYSAAAIYKYSTYQTGNDQVYFEQALWNTLEGRFMQQSDFNYATTVFTVDFMPALGLFVPVYWLFPSPHTLFITETLILALGALPVFWLARDKFNSRPIGLAFALVYFANPTLQYFNLLPFNLRALALVCLLYAFYFYQKQRFWLFGLFALLALGTRTEVSLIIAMFGLYGLLKRMPVRFWLTPLVVGAVYFVTVFSVILPAFISPGQMVVPPEVQPVTLQPAQVEYISNSETIIATTYGDLGKNLPDVLKNTITNPLKTFQRVFTYAKMEYLFLMLLPFAFLPLFSPSALLFCLPIVAINLLSIRATQYDYQSHYSALLLFGLNIGAIYGAYNLANWLKKRTNRLNPVGLVIAGLLLVILAVQILMRNPLPGAVINAENRSMVTATDALLARLPKNASVTATSFLTPHLLPRQYLYLSPLALYNPPPTAIQYFVIDTNAQAMYLQANDKVFGGKKPMDFLETDGRWKLIEAITILDKNGQPQKDRRGQPRQIQVWQSLDPRTPPLLPKIS
jgi:uncharacterized membrane protein